MEEITNKDGTISLNFKNPVEYKFFMYYYNLGKDFENTRSDTNV